MTSKTTTLDSVQFARALAAFAVLLTHLPHVANDIVGERALGVPEFLSFGYAGVDLFFVLSGFIIVHITTNKSCDVADFFRRRVIRVMPIYWLYTLAFVVMVRVSGVASPYDPDAVGVSLALFPQSGFPTLAVGWSLEHEIVYYLIVGVTLWRSASVLSVLAVCVAGAAALHVIYPFITEKYLWDWHLLSLYHVEFFLGVVVYRYGARLAGVGACWLLLLGAVGFSATHLALQTDMAGVANQTANEGLMGLVRVLGFGASASLVLAALVNAERKGSMSLLPTWLLRLGRSIGDASFSLYLSHTLVFMVVGKAYAWLGVPAAALVPCLIVATALGIAIALLSHRWIERPLLAVLLPKRHASRH